MRQISLCDFCAIYSCSTYGHVDGAHERDGVERVQQVRVEDDVVVVVEAELAQGLQQHRHQVHQVKHRQGRQQLVERVLQTGIVSTFSDCGTLNKPLTFMCLPRRRRMEMVLPRMPQQQMTSCRTPSSRKLSSCSSTSSSSVAWQISTSVTRAVTETSRSFIVPGKGKR